MSKFFHLSLLLFLTTALNAQTILFQDNFDTGINAGWTITNGGGGTGLTWERTSGGFDVMQWLGGGATSGSYITPSTEYIIVKCEAGGQQSDETLESPTIPSSAYTTLSLAFDQVFDRSSNEVGYVEIITNGSSWQNLATFNAETGTFLPAVVSQPVQINNQVIDISAYKNDNMKIRFRYTGSSGHWWALDNIKVTGTVGLSAPTPDFNSSGTVGCMQEDTIRFNDLSVGSPTSWEWSFSPNTVSFVGGTNLNSQNPRVIFAQGGKYNVKLKSTNASGSDSITKVDFVTLDSVPIVFAGNNVTACSNNNGIIDVSGTISGSATSGYWTSLGGNFGANLSLNTTFIPDSNKVPGNITIVLSSDGGYCNPVSDSFIVTYIEEGKVDAGVNFEACASTGASLFGAFKNATGIVWSGGNGSFIPNNTTKNALYLPSESEKNDSTFVILRIESVGGCSDTKDSVIYTLLKTDSCLQLSTNDLLIDEHISIYPNPTSSVLNILDKAKLIKSFIIINTLGNIVFEKIITNTVTNFDISALSKGIYYMQLTTKEGAIINKKIILN